MKTSSLLLLNVINNSPRRPCKASPELTRFPAPSTPPQVLPPQDQTKVWTAKLLETNCGGYSACVVFFYYIGNLFRHRSKIIDVSTKQAKARFTVISGVLVKGKQNILLARSKSKLQICIRGQFALFPGKGKLRLLRHAKLRTDLLVEMQKCPPHKGQDLLIWRVVGRRHPVG